MRVTQIILCMLLALKIAICQNGSISGFVKNASTHQPLANIEIEILELELTITSDDSGRFAFEDVPPGVYQLRASHARYVPVVLKKVIIEAGNETQVWIQLKVTASLIYNFGFEERPSQKEKTFQTRAESRAKTEGEKKSDDAPANEVRPPEPPPIVKDQVIEDETEYRPSTKSVHFESGLKAGYADDNRQFNYFLNFLKNYGRSVSHYQLKIDERIRLLIKDKNGKSLPNAVVRLYSNEQLVSSGQTYADGSFYIYPREYEQRSSSIRAYVQYGEEVKDKTDILINGARQVEVKLACQRSEFARLPLDLCFIVDATGSMSEEIERLKNTIEIINLNLSELKIQPAIRYGMVLYRDCEDDFVTRIIPFTENLETFQAELSAVKAEGGGDDPEDLQAALRETITHLDWNKDGLRLAFIITDAGTHLDYDEKYTYADACRDAKEMGVKIFSIGCGGLDIHGEYILRQIAQFTQGKYIFLTYGEKGESEGGKIGSVSHHTGSNYETDKLEAIILRFAKEELAHLTDLPIEQEQSYFLARRVEDEKKEATLRQLFARAIGELRDYSAIALKDGAALGAMPIAVKQESMTTNAEYFTEQLVFSLRQNKSFTLVERNDLQFVAKEVGLQLSGIVEPIDAVKIGEFMGAELLLIGNMYFTEDQYEIFLKLVRVETAEILAVTKVKIDYRLAL